MKRESRLHWAIALVALLLSLAPAWKSGLLLLARPSARRGDGVVPALYSNEPVRDATGTLVARGQYKRIVAIEGLDQLLSLVPEDRIVAVGDWSVRHSLEGWRVADRPRISGTIKIEEILSSHPDLVVTCSVGNPQEREAIASLRSLGVAVLDLSYTITIDDLLGQVTSLGALLEVPERSLTLREAVSRRCALLRLPFHSGQVPLRSVFICTFGERVSVGGSDDIFHEMLVGSGLRDSGAEAGLHLAPVVSVETAIKIDPQVLVIRPNNRRALSALPGIDAITSSGMRNISDIPEPMLGSATPLDVVNAMEAIQNQTYGAPAGLSTRVFPRSAER